MNSLFAFFVLSWISSAIGRSLLTPYIIGTWIPKGISSDYRSWWTDNPEEMTPISSISDAWPLFIGGIFTWYYMILTVRVFVVGFILISLGIALIIIVTFKWIPTLDTFLTLCFESIVHLNPLIICPVLIFSVSTWSKALLHSRLPMIDKITKITFIDLHPQLPNQTQQQETETYFTQLQSVWEHKS
ncbi:unnamed protein product [Caenorhabditis brenneri]